MSDKIKVLWFCNVGFSEAKSVSTGSWLYSMSESLMNTGEIELFNVTQGNVKEVTRQNYKSINQWFVPNSRIGKNGLPNSKIIAGIQKIVETVKPDIIHIWGTENYWGLLYSRGFINGNVILEIQGLKYACAKYFYTGLSLLDIVKCFRLKEFLRPSGSLVGLKLGFERWGKFEREMLLKAEYISTQSEWVRTYVGNVNNNAELIKTQIALRNEFLEATKWDVVMCTPFQIFTSTSSSSISYKGLHILFDAVAILKKRFPKIKLCIAGNISSGIRMDGYSKWLQDKIKKNGIAENINWLGSLDAEAIVTQMKEANVVVIPSFIETYCLALDEALTVGVPTVVSFSGAMPELAQHEKTALFYSPCDVEMCASAIGQFFLDKNLAVKISNNAYNDKSKKDNENIALSQLNVYKAIVNKDSLRLRKIVTS
jgi:glycosyltransferase involved in cell wall biosynthesis